MKISMKVIKHSEQRYETCGDWFYNQNTLHIRVSDMDNDDYHALIFIHEFVEALLCTKHNISEEAVTSFDEAFEAKRRVHDFSEPGDHPKAPYKLQHWIATTIERMFALALQIDWGKYEEAINQL